MSTAPAQSDARHVFLSHASADAEAAMRVCNALEQLNTKAWIAPRDIDPGKTYPAAIEAGIRASACVVVLLTEHSNASAEVLKEVELSLSIKKPVVALPIGGVKPEGGLAYHLASSQWLSWSEDARATAEQVIRFLQSVSPDAVGRTSWDSATRAMFTPPVQQQPGEGTVVTHSPASGVAPRAAPATGDLLQRLEAEARAPLSAGDRIGPYSVSELIGASDLSLTYRAERLGNRRTAVIRELLPRGLARRDARSSPVQWDVSTSALKKTRAALEGAVSREIKLAKTLKNLHLSRETARANGTLYSIRPFLAGATLAETLRSNGGRIAATEAADLFSLLLNDVAPLHAAGYLHGDIKPQNVILSSGESPKLIDFDALLEIGRPINAHLPVFVSEGFSAPELVASSVNGSSRTFDASLDLYALAATIFFCLTKQAPSPATADSRIDALIREQFVPWRTAAALGWCLAARPASRPKSVADVQTLLRP